MIVTAIEKLLAFLHRLLVNQASRSDRASLNQDRLHDKLREKEYRLIEKLEAGFARQRAKHEQAAQAHDDRADKARKLAANIKKVL